MTHASSDGTNEARLEHLEQRVAELEARLDASERQSRGGSSTIKSCSLCGTVCKRYLPDSSMESCPECTDGILRSVDA